MEGRHTIEAIPRGYWLLSSSQYLKLGRAHCTIPAGLDIVEFPLNVNGKSWFEAVSCRPSAISQSFELNADDFSYYHLINADAHVSPAPNAPSMTSEPSLIRPWRTASSKAMGIEAADVFPYRSRFSIIFSGESPRRSATALRMRIFAWCGT